MSLRRWIFIIAVSGVSSLAAGCNTGYQDPVVPEDAVDTGSPEHMKKMMPRKPAPVKQQ